MVWLGFDGSPLRRRADHIESAVLLMALLISVAVLPLALFIGMSVRGHLQAVAERQVQSRLPVVGTVVPESTARKAVVVVMGHARRTARVVWTTPGGLEQTGTVTVPADARPGSAVTLWTTADGRLTTPPLTSSQIVADAMAAGVVVLVSAMAVAWMAFLGVRHVLDRCRYRAWDAEWLQIVGGS